MEFLTNSTIKTVIFWLVILVSATLLWQVVKSGNSRTQPAPEISYSQFLTQVDAGNVVMVRISKTRADGIYHNGGPFRVNVPGSQEQMLQTLRQKNVEIWYADSPEQSGWGWLVNLFAPLVLLAALWFFMIRQMKTKANLENARTAATAGKTWQNK